jgi:hypothetical protein
MDSEGSDIMAIRLKSGAMSLDVFLLHMPQRIENVGLSGRFSLAEAPIDQKLDTKTLIRHACPSSYMEGMVEMVAVRSGSAP